MHVTLKEDPREWRRYTLQVCAVLLLFLGIFSWRDATGAAALPWLIALVVLVSLAALLRPRWFRGFYRLGMTASAWLGERTGWVFLTVFFFLLVVPLGWALRRAGHDPLGLRRRPGRTSYWRPAAKPGKLENMF
jgi:hypothetical protein